VWVLLPICIHYRLFKVGSNQISVKALLQGKASIAILVSCNFLYHDKSSSMFHADFFLQIGKGGKSSDVIWSKEQRVSSICMIMSSLSGFSILAGTICKKNLQCCNLLTSNQDLWLVRHKIIVILAVQKCSIPKCVSCNF
jgi:hypothetical protein